MKKILILLAVFLGGCNFNFTSKNYELVPGYNVLTSKEYKYRFKAIIWINDGTNYEGHFLTNNNPQNEPFYIQRCNYLVVEDESGIKTYIPSSSIERVGIIYVDDISF